MAPSFIMLSRLRRHRIVDIFDGKMITPMLKQKMTNRDKLAAAAVTNVKDALTRES